MDAHPRLFWNQGEVEALRAKAAHPEMAALRDRILALCETYVDRTHKDFIDTGLSRKDLVGVTHNCGHTWPKLTNLILAAILTDDPRWPDLLTRVLRVFTQDPSPMQARIFSHWQHCGFDDSLLGGVQKNLTSQGGMIPLMLDLLWDRLGGDDRRAACDFLNREIVEPFLRYALDESKDAAITPYLGVNPCWWEFYSWVWSLAVIYDEQDPRHRRAMEIVIRRMRCGIHMAADEAGVIGEGPGYGAIEIFNWWTVAEILRRMGFCDFWKGDARFLEIMKARVFYQLPNGHGLLDHGDTERHGGWYADLLIVMLLHAQRTGDPAYQACWEKLAMMPPDKLSTWTLWGPDAGRPRGKLLENGGGGFPTPGIGGPLGYLGYWLWCDPRFVHGEGVAMTETSWPLARPGGQYGLHFVRSGWGEEDLHFAFFAAGRSPGTYIHQHTDAGHFSLCALGEIFCAGRAYGHNFSSHHNVLRPRGEEPPGAPTKPIEQSWCGGYTLASAHGSQSNYVAANLAWQWGCVSYHRHALVLRLPGTDPYLLILDSCNRNNDWDFYDWQFQVQPECRVEILPSEAQAVVHGQKNRLEIAWATYARGEYPKPQGIELLTEQLHHVYADQPNHYHHDTLRYTCLIARLTGYNGILLSALVPRRAGSAPAGIRRFHAPHQIGMHIDHGQWIDTVVANPLIRRITIGGLDADASIVVVRRDKAGRVRAVSAGDCFAVSVGGMELLPPSGVVKPLFEHESNRKTARRGTHCRQKTKENIA